MKFGFECGKFRESEHPHKTSEVHCRLFRELIYDSTNESSEVILSFKPKDRIKNEENFFND